MIDYTGLGAPSPPRRGGHGRLMAAGAICVMALLALLAGHALTSRPAPAAAAAGPAQPGTDTAPGGAWTLGACIDPTLSLIPSFATTIRADLAQGVAALAPPSTPVATNAQPGQPVSAPRPSVSLTVREIDTTSFASTMSSYTRTVEVPAVPGLMVSRPAPGSADYVGRLKTWTQDYVTVTNDRKAAATAAAAASSSIASLPLDRLGDSAISACVSGLLVTVPASGNHSYLLASDLAENIAPQLHGSFNGASLYIVQACDDGDGNHCAALLERFTKEMRRLHVGQVIPIRPEDAGSAITNWIRTGDASP